MEGTGFCGHRLAGNEQHGTLRLNRLAVGTQPCSPGHGLWQGSEEQPGLHGHGTALSRGCDHQHPLDGGLG